jgi:hypothetical protein
MEKLISRKFIMTVGLVVLSYILVLVGKMTSKEWIEFSMVIAGIYTFGNVGSKFVARNEK